MNVEPTHTGSMISHAQLTSGNLSQQVQLHLSSDVSYSVKQKFCVWFSNNWFKVMCEISCVLQGKDLVGSQRLQC